MEKTPAIPSISKPKKKKAKKKTSPVTYQYCFGCKDVQELSGDQCSVCFNYIVF